MLPRYYKLLWFTWQFIGPQFCFQILRWFSVYRYDLKLFLFLTFNLNYKNSKKKTFKKHQILSWQASGFPFFKNYLLYPSTATLLHFASFHSRQINFHMIVIFLFSSLLSNVSTLFVHKILINSEAFFGSLCHNLIKLLNPQNYIILLYYLFYWLFSPLRIKPHKKIHIVQSIKINWNFTPVRTFSVFFLSRKNSLKINGKWEENCMLTMCANV